MKIKILLGGLLCSSLLPVANAAVYNPTAGTAGENRGSFNSRQIVDNLGDRWKVQDGSYQIRSIGGGLPTAIESTRNYHIFNIPALAAGETVTEVSLMMPHPSGSYQSPDATETFGLFDIDPANFAFLRSPSELNGQTGFTLDDLETAYTDLGEGTSYGTFDVSTANNGTTQSVLLPDLNAVLTAFGQAGGGDFGMGGAILTHTHNENGGLERTFRASTNFPDLSSLQITTTVVPVPAAAWLFGSGLLGLIGTAQRRKTNSA